MESLKISTGVVKLRILDDFGNERGIFSFNPEDIKSAQAVLDLQKELDTKEIEFNERVKHCETPQEQVQLLSDVVEYFEQAIDRCFGTGSSSVLFGEAQSISMFEDFFDGITPYYKDASEKRIAKYKNKGGK